MKLFCANAAPTNDRAARKHPEIFLVTFIAHPFRFSVETEIDFSSENKRPMTPCMRGLLPHLGGVALMVQTSVSGGAFWGEVTVHVSLRSPDSRSPTPYSIQKCMRGSVAPRLAPVALAIRIRPIFPPLHPQITTGSTQTPSQREQMDFPYIRNLISKVSSITINDLDSSRVTCNADLCTPMSKETPSSLREIQQARRQRWMGSGRDRDG